MKSWFNSGAQALIKQLVAAEEILYLKVLSFVLKDWLSDFWMFLGGLATEESISPLQQAGRGSEVRDPGATILWVLSIKILSKSDFSLKTNLLGKWILHLSMGICLIKTNENNCKHIEKRKRPVKNQYRKSMFGNAVGTTRNSLSSASHQNSPLKSSSRQVVRSHGD